jgi:hypothetical protein
MSHCSVSQHSARRWTCILLLAALCAIPAAAQGVTPTPAAAVSPQAVTATAPAPVSAETAEFLASLSAAPAVPQAPSPVFLQTTNPGCTSDSQCPTGTLCCRDCGYFGCTHKGCLQPLNGQCPAVP